MEDYERPPVRLLNMSRTNKRSIQLVGKSEHFLPNYCVCDECRRVLVEGCRHICTRCQNTSYCTVCFCDTNIMSEHEHKKKYFATTTCLQPLSLVELQKIKSEHLSQMEKFEEK